MIPDHPVIRSMERTGYPQLVRERTVYCVDCNTELVDEDMVFDYDGYALCEDCFRDRLMEDMSADDLARKLGFIVKAAYDYAEEMEEE